MNKKPAGEGTARIGEDSRLSQTGTFETESDSVMHPKTQVRTPWSYDEQRYAKLVNVAGNLKLYGWILFSFNLLIGLAFFLTGFGRDNFNQKILCFSFALGFILVGSVVKVVWGVFSELINLLIDVANDVHAISDK